MTANLPSPAMTTVKLLESDLPKIVCSGQLSNRTQYTLRVDGPFSKREADALIHLLTEQMKVFDDIPY